MEDGGIMVELGMWIIIAGGIKYAIVRRDLLKVYPEIDRKPVYRFTVEISKQSNSLFSR